jgi:HEAT repeat protein
MAAYLGEHDVATAAELRALDGSPQKPLMAIARDGKAPPLVRARAVAALRVVATPEVHDFLAKLIDEKATTTDQAERLVLRRAAITQGWLAGPDAAARLASLFANADPEVRVDAAIGLGLTRSAEAPDLLRRQLGSETVPRVRDQIERQLRALGANPSPDAQKAPPKPERPPMRGGF